MMAVSIPDIWESLGSAQGYVVGALVTAVGLAVNAIVLWLLERARGEREFARDSVAAEKERESRLEAARLELYAAVLSACDDLAYCNWYADGIDRTRVAEYNERARTARSTVRMLTDNRDLIDAVDEFSDACAIAALAESPWSSELQERLRKGRRSVVIEARTELGRADIDISSGG